MAQTISNILPILKEVFASEDVQKQFDEGTLLLDIIEKGDQGAPQFTNMLGEYDGKYVVFPLHTGGNPNVGVGVAEGYEYPKEGGQTFNQAKYRCKYVVSSMGLTTQTMTRAKGNPQSLFNYAGKEASLLIQNTRRRMNFWAHGDGSGLLATTTSWANATGILTVNSTANLEAGMEFIARPLSGAKTTNCDIPVYTSGTTVPTAWATTFGSDIATGNPARVLAKTGATTVTVTSHSGTAVVTGGPADAAWNTDFGIYAFDSQGNVPFGMANLCQANNPLYSGFCGTTLAATDSTGLSPCFGAIDRTTAAGNFWKPINNTDDGITTALGSLPVSITTHIQPLISAILSRDSSLVDQDSIIAVSRMSQWYQIVNQLESGKRTDVRTSIIDGKYEVVRYGPITFCYDQQSPANTMRFFAPRYVFRMVATPWQFEDLAGSEYSQILGGLSRQTSKWRKNLFSEQQLCASSCRPNCEFTGIAS